MRRTLECLGCALWGAFVFACYTAVFLVAPLCIASAWAQGYRCHYVTRSRPVLDTWTNTVTTQYYQVRQCYRNHTYHLPEREPTRVYSYERRRDRDDQEAPPPRLKCHGVLEGIGGRTLTREGGIKVAERAWQSTSLNKWGERYMDITFAKDYRWTCHRASTNESIFGRGAETIAGRFSYRCTVWAMPCEAPVYAGRPDKDALEKTQNRGAYDDEDGTEETRAPRRDR